MQQLKYCSFVLLLLASLNAAELSEKSAKLAEDLGYLLGLPLDADTPSQHTTEVPDFLMDIYNCWTALESTEGRSTCLPVRNVKDMASLQSINVVRTIKNAGTQAINTPRGIYSHSTEETPLPKSVAFNFNLTVMKNMREDVQYAYIRIPKQSLTTEEYEKIQCIENDVITLQLLVKINTTADSQGVFTLLSKATLSRQELSQKMHIEFHNISKQLKDWIQMSKSPEQDLVETQLIVGGSCYSQLEPTQLGIRQAANSSAFLVAYSKSDDSNDALIRAGLAELAAEATASRERRSAETVDNSTTVDEEVAFNISSFHLLPCRRYTHSITFAELGWADRIIQPTQYQANFCAGSCEFPVTTQFNTTKHSYIQSLAAKYNPDLVPPPCCVPHKLAPVSVIFNQGADNIVTHEWDGMKAESCGCK